jgi:hypothetical protein
MRRSRLEKLRDTSRRWSNAMDGIAYQPKLLPCFRLRARCVTLAYLCVRSRAWHECVHDEVDHLIECRFWLVGVLGDHQRIEEPPRGRDRKHRSENNVRYFEHPLFRAIINDLRNDSDHTLDVPIIDLPAVPHSRRYHPMEIFIAEAAPSIHEMNGREKPSQPIDDFSVLGRDRCRRRFKPLPPGLQPRPHRWHALIRRSDRHLQDSSAGFRRNP